MPEPTLETLEKRIESLESEVAELKGKGREPKPKKDWRRVLGMFTDSEFMKQVDAEGEAIREADRKAPQEEQEGKTE